MKSSHSNYGSLLMTRALGEKLFIGDDITFTMLGPQGKETLMQIQAPKERWMLREELIQSTRSFKRFLPAKEKWGRGASVKDSL